jgi:DNA end-binding protein Ku
MGLRISQHVIAGHAKGIVLWTLRYGDEVLEADDYFDSVGDAKADSELMPLIQQLIKQQHWDPKMVVDPVQDRLLDLIAEKKNALKKPAKRKTKPMVDDTPASNVINIMDALRKSVEADQRPRR